MTIMYTVSGEAIDVLPVGTRVRHRRHPELVGIVVRHELRVRVAVGGMYWYADNGTVMPVGEEGYEINQEAVEG